MKVLHATWVHELDAPLEAVFAFFSNPSNLTKLTPPAMNMLLLTPPPWSMRRGSVFDYRVSIAGWPMRWTAYIAEFEPPHRFVDLQLRGPYAYWHHTHTFEARGRRTVIGDHIVYAMPFGPLGQAAHRLFARRRLDAIFAYRREVLEKGIDWSTVGAQTRETGEVTRDLE